VTPPDLLAFAELKPPRVPVVPVEHHVAEKVHAFTRNYGGHVSTRVKDLIDLVLMAVTMAFEAGRLRAAHEATFAARGSHPLPTHLPSPPSSWAGPYRQLANEVGIELELDAGHHIAARFLDPLLSGQLANSARWEPSERQWS